MFFQEQPKSEQPTPEAALPRAPHKQRQQPPPTPEESLLSSLGYIAVLQLVDEWRAKAKGGEQQPPLDIDRMSVKELKRELSARRVPHTKAVEKAKYVRCRDFIMNVHSTLRTQMESGLTTAVGATHRMMSSLLKRL